MTLKIEVLNRQKICRLNSVKLKKLAAFFLNKLDAGQKQSFGEITLLLADDAGIQPVNRQFFERDGATDVISFRLPAPPPGKKPAGEIALNVERALHEGRRRRGFTHELALYLAHGCNHLAGHDDRTLKARRSMRRRELHWLREAAGLDLLVDLENTA